MNDPFETFNDPRLLAALIGHIATWPGEQQRDAAARAIDEGRVSYAVRVDGVLEVFLIEEDGSHPVMLLDATRFGFELDDNGNVTRP